MSRPRHSPLTLLGAADPVLRTDDGRTPEQELERAVEALMARILDYQGRLQRTALRCSSSEAAAQQVAEITAEWMTGLHSEVSGLWVGLRDYLRQQPAPAATSEKEDRA